MVKVLRFKTGLILASSMSTVPQQYSREGKQCLLHTHGRKGWSLETARFSSRTGKRKGVFLFFAVFRAPVVGKPGPLSLGGNLFQIEEYRGV